MRFANTILALIAVVLFPAMILYVVSTGTQTRLYSGVLNTTEQNAYNMTQTTINISYIFVFAGAAIAVVSIAAYLIQKYGGI